MLNILMITSEWPTSENPHSGIFVKKRVEALKREGVVIDLHFFRGGGNPFKYFSERREIRKKIANSKYDLVHAQFGQSGFLALPKKIPLVVTFRGSDLNGFIDKSGSQPIKSKLLVALSKYVARHADRIIVVSKELADIIPQYKSVIIPSGINLAEFESISVIEARKKLGLDKDKFIVFFPSNPNNPIKQYEKAREAFEIFNGKKDYQLIKAENIPHNEMMYYYNAANVVLFTSKNEGSPNVFKEALACNTPVVTFDVGDVKELSTGSSGIFITKENVVSELVKGLEYVYNQNNNNNNLRSLIDHLSIERTTQRVIESYKSLGREY